MTGKRNNFHTSESVLLRGVRRSNASVAHYRETNQNEGDHYAILKDIPSH